MIYNLICNKFCKDSIASEYNEPKQLNSIRNIVDSNDEIVRLPTKYKLIHLDYLLIVDKVKSNLYCNYNKIQ